MKVGKAALGDLARVRTGMLDANASSPNGKYPFFTCAINPLRIDTFSYDCECVLVAGNGDLNVKYYNGRFDAYQRTYIVEPISQSLDCRYLYHFLDSYLAELRKLSIGGVIKYIRLGNLTDAKIPLPPLEEQQRIAAILDKAEKISSLLKVQNAVAESFMQSAFIDLFGNPKEEPRNSLFSVTTLGKCCTLFSGGTLPDGEENTGQEGGFLLLKVSDMNLPGNEERIKTSKLWTTSPGAKSATCPAGSVIIPKRGGAIGTNKKRVVDRDAVLDPNLMAIAPGDQTITTEFIRGWFSFLDLSSITSGSSVPQLNKQDLSPLRLAIPPLQAQERYRELATCALSMSDRYQKQSARSHALLAALHRKYFSGDNHE